MAEEANLNDGNLGNQVFSGIVQFAVPSFGWAFVTPAGANSVDKGLICRLQGVGGIYGGGVWDCPTPGTFVTVRRQKDTDVGYIIEQNNQGTQQQTFASVARLRQSQAVPCISSMEFIKKLLQRIQKIDSKQKATFTGALQDQYAGDTVIGDRHGPQVFFGRTQMQLKGSDLSYIQLDATKDKITTVTVESQLDTFSDKKTITTDLNKTLKASGDFQGMGGRGWKKDPILQQDTKLCVKYKADVKDPIFRFQQFNGGAARGCHTTIVHPLKQKEDQQPVVMAQLNSYNGEHLRISARSNISIKSPFVSGLVQKQRFEKADVQRIKNITDKLNKINLSQNGVNRALLLDAIIQQDTRKLLYDMLGTSVQQLMENGVDPLGAPLGQDLPWEGAEPPDIGEIMSDYPSVQLEDELLGTALRSFKNTSFITQDPDGSITLKDGWGSQITMSHGNIYISSALDTFIRPGRDLIQLVPRNLCASTNGQMEVAAKDSINIGTEKNLVMASAINGQQGYTVLENRTLKEGQNTGLVIRSNGKLTMTASDDMHIGINDKRNVNNGEKVNIGSGSIYIYSGERGMRIQSLGQLRLAGSPTGIYTYEPKSKKGTGIQLGAADVTIVATAVNMDTKQLIVGGFPTTYTIQVGPTGQDTITLNKGGSSLTVHIRGDLQSKDFICYGNVVSTGFCLADIFATLKESNQYIIPGLQKAYSEKIITQITRGFKSKLQSYSIDYGKPPFQPWYNDAYICQKQLAFSQQWQLTKIPQMCWQRAHAGGDFDVLKKISVKATGGQSTETCAYPGKDAWNSCKIITVKGDNFEPKQLALQGNYKTYKEKGN